MDVQNKLIQSEDQISYLSKQVQQFCEERDWDQFHSSKDLAIGVATEACELLAEFRFLDNQQVQALWLDRDAKTRIEDELADVFMFVLRFAQRNEINLGHALLGKLQKTALKYPVEKAKGRNEKYNKL